MLKRIWALILKELQTLLHDRNSRRLIILPVIIQVALFPFAATLEVKNNTIAIYNQDIGIHAIELTQRFSQAKAFSHLRMLHSANEVTEAIDTQQALLAINIPNNFSNNITAGRSANLQIIIDGRRSNAAQIATGYIENIVQQYQEELQTKANNQPSSPTIVVRNWFNPNLNYQWFILPSLIAMITTVGCLVVTALSLAREREQGTFEQLLVSPLTPAYIMLGKAIPALIIAILQASIILLASIFIYRIPFAGSILLLYICLIFYGLSLAGIGLLISSICATQQQAFLGVFGFMMPAVVLSGFVSPIENIPEPLRALTWFNPLRHFIVVAKGIYLKEFDMALIWENLWPLLVIACVTLVLAYGMFRRSVK